MSCSAPTAWRTPPPLGWCGARTGCRWVTDGPYLETKEYIGSLYLLDCESLERAQQIVADMPLADREPIELWPVLHESAADR